MDRVNTRSLIEWGCEISGDERYVRFAAAVVIDVLSERARWTVYF